MHMIDYGQFATKLAQRTDRWSLLEEYVRDWRLPVAGRSRYSAMDITDAEDQLGFKLPLALREWYQLPYQPYQLTRDFVTCHCMLGPAELKLANGWSVFHLENQDCCEWAIYEDDAHLDDPPVYAGTTEEEDTHPWQLQNQTLSEFCLQMVMRETLCACGYEAHAENVQPDELERLEQHFAPLGFPTWWEMPQGSRFFGGPDALLIVWQDWPNRGQWSVTLGARSLEGLQHARAQLNIRWDDFNESGKRRF